MKVLHINSASNWGGGEVHTFELCQQLIKKNLQIMLACRPDSPIGQKFREYSMPVVETPLKGAIDFYSAIKIYLYCHKNKVDIIHCHLARDYWIARYVKIILPQVKLIFTRHLTNPIRSSKLHKWLFKRVDMVISVSDAVRKSLLRQKLISASKIITIYNGIKVDDFLFATPAQIREELNIANNTKIIGIVGQISSNKGQDILIKSFPHIHEIFSNSIMVIVGSDFKEDQYINKLKTLGESLGISKKLFFLGLRHDIPNLLKTFDVFVLASENEAFGIVLVEAMAAGIPVVATDIEGPKEIIIHEKTGLLVKPGNPLAFSEAILRILQNNNLKENFISEGLQRVRNFFSIEAMTNSIIHTYEQIYK